MEYEYSSKDEAIKYGTDVFEPVPAIYTKALLSVDEGNPFIESLPRPLNDKELVEFYYKRFPMKPSKEAPEEIQRAEIRLLKNVRFPLPFVPEVEKSFNNALVESYRAREGTMVFKSQPITMLGMEGRQTHSFRSATGADTGMGLSLIGIGGSGKSAAISTMLTRYPQVIVHDWGNRGQFTQIVWIAVTTPANANLSDLFTTMAEAVDEALGNDRPVYAKGIAKEKSVGMKAEYIAKLVRIFGIGAIVMDEVQNLDRKRNRESSLDSLMTLINTTKVAIVIVGTQDAMSMIYAKYYLARRAGKMINANNYCSDRRQFEIMMNHVVAINWFKTPFKLTTELLDALFEETNGIIDRMITLWIEIQNAYVSAKEKPEITPKLIHLVANSTAPLMSVLARETLKDSVFSTLEDENVSGDVVLTYIRGKENESAVEKILDSMDDKLLATNVYKRVKEHLLLSDKAFNDMSVIEAVKHVCSLKKNQDLGEVDLAKKTIEYLSRKKSDKRPQKRKVNDEEMENFIDQYLV